MAFMLIGSFVLFLLLFLLIGVASAAKSRGSTSDYLVAERSIAPWLTALSAVATNNSGYMFIGMIGLTYKIGFSSIWLMVGWITGDLIASLLCLKSIREKAEQTNSRSLGSLLGRWQGHDYLRVRRLAGVLTLIFLSGYAAAQFKAGGKTLQSLFDWNPVAGILIGGVIVLAYSLSGGIRASIWTDAAQSAVMLVGMALMLVAGLNQFDGGWSEANSLLQQVSPTFMDWFSEPGLGKAALFVAGWFFGGVAVIGQPHIISRFLALRSAKDLPKMRVYYYSWFTIFYGLTIAVGLLCRLLLPPSSGFDAEMALPMIAIQLLPDVGVGLILAAIFAATMSTADSLILGCTASFTEDFSSTSDGSLGRTKTVTALVMLGAVVIALWDNQSVFGLVLMAWGLLAAAFTPLLLLLSAKRKLSEAKSLATMLTGVGVFFLWRITGLSADIYEVAPAILAGLVLGGSLSLGAMRPQKA